MTTCGFGDHTPRVATHPAEITRIRQLRRAATSARPSRAPLLRTVADMVNNNSEVTAVERFYAASGPMATTVMECEERYYTECLMSGRGAFTVWLSSGDVEHIAGTRYLDVERLRGDEIDGALEIIYLGEVVKKYPAGTWTRWETVEAADPFTG